MELKMRIEENPSVDVELGLIQCLVQSDHELLENRDKADQHPIAAVTGLSEKLESVDAEMEKQASEIKTNSDTIEKLTEKSEKQTSEIKANAEKIEKNASGIKTNAEEIKTLAAKADTQAEAIKANAALLDTHGDTLALHATALQQHGNALETHAEKITAVEKATTTNAEVIALQGKRISEIDSTLTSFMQNTGSAFTALQDWVLDEFLKKADAEEMMSSKLRLTFGEDFAGQTYTVTGGSGETYTGVVPDSLTAKQAVKELDTVYNVTCKSANGYTYDHDVKVGYYYGMYPFDFQSFLAYVYVKADRWATITVTGGKKTYTGQTDGDGYATIGITVADTYAVTATRNNITTQPVSVVVSTQGTTYDCTCPSVLPAVVSWTDGTDEEISVRLDEARAGRLNLQEDMGWAVGDVRTISLAAFEGANGYSQTAQDIDIVITSFDEYMGCGNVMQFDFLQALRDQQSWHSSDVEFDNYGDSDMYKTVLPNMVYALPEWLQSRLLEFSVLSSKIMNSEEIIEIPNNKLALRSAVEMWGVESAVALTYSAEEASEEPEIISNEAVALSYNAGAVSYSAVALTSEGTQLEYYANEANRRKMRGKGINIAAVWWTRTRLETNHQINFVSNAGGRTSWMATSGYWFAPFGCL